ncbi:MAG: DUF721 domain-containing protein [Desulfovibrionaceae bacterium]|jgi:hypothetical protein|nr:DUF721 domain-containing protein [Desulfovibrionaceae bacterium]
MDTWRKRLGKWEKGTWRAHPLGPALRAYLRTADTKGSMPLVRLWRGWAEAVGAHVAEMAKPVGHRRRTLLVGVEDSALLQELTYYAPQILDDVNAFLGQEVFDKVQVDLLMGKAPLDTIPDLAPGSGDGRPDPERPPERPEGLQGRADLDPESPVGRCYRAYIRLFNER